ncbi:hypothetical protein [Hymenobacter properus]|uniref:Uncharacterized protein n=1 Tax=Hymenobacter properus TaxID=2791026 RepID=A0A931BKJ1_9BACT|nr:hypothetical protein [Hymenobacter properus]MBF9141948.1 hypothetical protein [Hymenobacter properus]MBR7720755.1 hypothetical protein [Microvirga sp. SRT04]
MIYADLNSFFEMDVACALGKQRLLEEIAAGQDALDTIFDVDYNVYRLVIRFHDNHVEFWDAIRAALEDGQEPDTTTLEAFQKAVEAYVPGTIRAEFMSNSAA